MANMILSKLLTALFASGLAVAALAQSPPQAVVLVTLDGARIVGRKTIWHPSVPQRVIVNQAIGERRPIHSYGARATDVSEAFEELWLKVLALETTS